MGHNCHFKWKPRKPNHSCCWKCIISSLCSLTPLISLTYLACHVPFLRPPASSPQLEMPETARSTSCGCGLTFLRLHAEWIAFQSRSFIMLFKIQQWTMSGYIRHKRVPAFLFLFKKWFCNDVFSRNTIIGQPRVRFLSSHITSLAILRRGKAGYAPWENDNTCFKLGKSLWVFSCVWGKANTQCSLPKYGMCCVAGRSFSTMSHPSGWRQQGLGQEMANSQNETRLSQGSHWFSGTIKHAHPETASAFSFLEIARSEW